MDDFGEGRGGERLKRSGVVCEEGLAEVVWNEIVVGSALVGFEVLGLVGRRGVEVVL